MFNAVCLNFDWEATPVAVSYVAFLALLLFSESCEMSDFCICRERIL